jgi:hypothetical protein
MNGVASGIAVPVRLEHLGQAGSLWPLATARFGHMTHKHINNVPFGQIVTLLGRMPTSCRIGRALSLMEFISCARYG